MAETTTGSTTQIRIASTIALIVAAWLIAVNFLLLRPVTVVAPWNHAILGLAIALMAGYRMARPHRTQGLSWMIAVLGLWVIISPFAFGYSGVDEVLWTDLVAGLVLFASGLWGGLAGRAEP